MKAISLTVAVILACLGIFIFATLVYGVLGLLVALLIWLGCWCIGVPLFLGFWKLALLCAVVIFILKMISNLFKVE